MFTLFRIEQKQWRYVTQRDYVGVLQAVVVLTLAVVGLVAIAKPHGRLAGEQVSVGIPSGVLALFFLLSLALVGGVRFIGRGIADRAGPRLPRAQGRGPRADRRRR